MSSNTAKSEKRRARTHQRAGHRRKLIESRKSTLSLAELFASLGEPGQPAPKAAPKAPKAAAVKAAPKAEPKAASKAAPGAAPAKPAKAAPR